MEKVYGFEYLYPEPYRQTWQLSKKRFDNSEAASKSAAEWMEICFINELIIAIRLCEVGT